MKKLIFALISTISTLLLIFFTSLGQNKVIIPVVNFILTQKIKNHKVEIKEVNLSIDSLEARLTIDKNIDIFLTGPVAWKEQKFKLKYLINSEKVELNREKIVLNMDIQGFLTGNLKNMDVKGAGRAFDASVKFKFKIVDENISSIKAVAVGAETKQILALLKQPLYFSGKANILLNVPKLDLKNPSGKVIVKIDNGKLNIKLISKILDTKLPLKSNFKLKAKGIIKKRVLISKLLFINPLMSLNIHKLITTLNFNQVRADYKLKIADLAYLKSLTKKSLRGNLSVNGKAYFNKKDEIVQVLVNSKSLGGESKVFYNNKSLNISLKSIDFSKLIYMANLPKYIKRGVLTFKAKIKNIDILSGRYSLKAKGKLNRELLKEEFEFDPLKESFKFLSIGNLKNTLLYSKKTALETPLTRVILTNMRYSLKEKHIKSKYFLKIANLLNFQSLIGAELRGKFETYGKMNIDLLNEMAQVAGSTKSIGGVLNYHYNDGDLSLNLKRVNGVKLLYMLKQPPYFKSSTINGQLNLQNIKNLTGIINLTSSGRVNQKTVKDINKLNIGSNLKYQLKFSGNIISKKLASTIKLKTSIFKLNLSPFNYDLDSKRVIGEYSLNIPNLAKMKAILKNRYYGSLDLKGQFWSDEVLHISGVSEKWDGNVSFRLDDNQLRADAKHIQIFKLFKTIGYKPILKGLADASLKYNIDEQKGIAKIDIGESTLVRTKLIKMLDLIIHKDLTREIFNQASIISRISKNLLNFNLDLFSNRHRVFVNDGKIDRKRDKIDALIVIYDGVVPYKARIKGSLKKPKVIPLITKDLRQKAMREVKRILRKNGVRVDKIEKKIYNKIDEYAPKDNFLEDLF